jgi:peptidoglycan/LPS O-acetylase OafA/YrhL
MNMTTSKHESGKWRSDIDGLRAVAVIFVLLYHAFPFRFKGGFVGVDIFFVISGYLIGKAVKDEIDRQEFSLSQFYYRRIRRIYPALIVVVFSTCLAGYFLLSTDFAKIGKHAAASSIFLANFSLLQESGYFDGNPEGKPLMHLWSLAVEEQFYLLWPLAILLLIRWMNFTVITAVMAALSFMVCIYLTKVDQSAAYFMPWSRGWELLVGVLASQWKFESNESTSNWIKWPAQILGILLLIASFILIKADPTFPGFWALMPVIGATLLIKSGCSKSPLANPLLVYIGKISYPVYLWHWPLLCIPFLFRISGSASLKFSLLTLSMVLGFITYKILETPIRSRPANSKLAATLCTAMALVGILGLVIWRSNGLAYRYPDDVRLLLENVRPIDSAWRSQDCFLRWVDPAGSFGDSCIEHGQGPLVALWGDSHAAALAEGLRRQAKAQGYRFAQLTSAGCPPFLGNSDPRVLNCKGNNQIAFAKLFAARPDTIVLVADWYLVDDAVRNNLTNSYQIDGLKRTIDQIRAQSSARIVIIGPPPSWLVPLPSAILLLSKERFGAALPVYTSQFLNQNIQDVDNRTRRIALNLKVEYFPLKDLLCVEEKCRLHINGTELTTYDHDHLSPSAADLVASEIPDLYHKQNAASISNGALQQPPSSALDYGEKVTSGNERSKP